MAAQPTRVSLPHQPLQVVLMKTKNTWLAVFLLKKSGMAKSFISSLGKGILLKGKPQSEMHEDGNHMELSEEIGPHGNHNIISKIQKLSLANGTKPKKGGRKASTKRSTWMIGSGKRRRLMK